VPEIAYPPQHRHDGDISTETKDQTALVAADCDPRMSFCAQDGRIPMGEIAPVLVTNPGSSPYGT
jgi:hypothetical protein